MLTFSQTDKHLLVGGKTFYVKDIIRMVGGKWQPSSSSWAVPFYLDNEGFRETLQKDAETAYKAIKKKEREERRAQRDYENSPEGMAAASSAEREKVRRCFEQKTVYYWICCADCNVIDWHKQHTSCMKCAEWDGYSWNSFRVRGSIFTGD
jgi:hypothetical protein